MNIRMMIALGLAATTAMACGGDDKEGGEPISHTTARQAISENTTSISARVSASLGFLENSALITRGLDLSNSGDCIVDDGTGADFDSGECSSTPIELDTDLSAPTSELTEILETRIFADANIEASTATSVTYLLQGDVVCDGGEQAPDQDCIDQVDAAQIRLVVTSPASGDVDVAIQVGPQRHNPLSLEFHQTSLAAEVDLGALKGAVEHITNGEADGFPDTFAGRIRGEIAANSANSVTATLSVLSAVSISGGDDVSLSIAASNPTLQVTADGGAQTLSAALDLGAMQLMGPMGSEEWDEELQDYVTVESQIFDLNVAGVSGSTTFSGATDTLSFTNLGLGSTPTTFKVDGQQVLSVLINNGATFSASIAETAAGTSIEVSPKFDLKAVMNFEAMGQDFDAWMNDTLSITLDGAAAPKLLIADGQTKVVEGQLSMSLLNAGNSVTVAANQCLLIAESEVLDPVDPLEPVEPVEPVTSGNPFDDMSAGACE